MVNKLGLNIQVECFFSCTNLLIHKFLLDVLRWILSFLYRLFEIFIKGLPVDEMILFCISLAEA